tara:strand:- start:2570 stop:3190 length:621 start_codon:yes stop_codon:yes gene_type:complete
MGKYTGATCRISRREGTDLGFKSGVRDIKSKCNLERIPGQHWSRRVKLTDYALQLRMKQMIRRYYGLREKQFRQYYKTADRMKGSTGENLLRLLELRLDNIVYRLGFASTRAEARQLVSHKSIVVNGSVVNVPSFLVSKDDVVEVRSKAKKQLRITAALDLSKQRTAMTWLDLDEKELKGKLTQVPEVDQLPAEFKVNLVVELYSK